MNLQIELREGVNILFQGLISGGLECGRQAQGEPSTGALIPYPPLGQRLVVADADTNRIGRRQLQLEKLSPGLVQLKNISSTVDLRIHSDHPLEAGKTRSCKLPVSVAFTPTRMLTVSESPSEQSNDPELDSALESLNFAPRAPGSRTDFQETFAFSPEVFHRQGDDPVESVLRILQEVMEVFRNAPSEDVLFKSAVSGAVRIVRFDAARLLLYDGRDWNQVQELHAGTNTFSRHVLQQVLRDRRTFWSGGSFNATASLAMVDAVVAAPILDRDGDVIGALYAERQQDLQMPDRQITRIDAQKLELLACGVASELARQSQERESRRHEKRFEQFFSPKLAHELNCQPDLLEGRDVDVSVLFCDIRRFSRISENVDTRTVFSFINDVIGVISQCIEKYDGVVVDYVGDAVMGMFGAPRPQPDHHTRAARAALEMLRELPRLNADWKSRIPADLDVDFAIGINSGRARAGNSGCESKYKYGPLGNTVNLASRIQGVTKHLQSRILISRATADHLDANFVHRKVCDARVVNIREPVSLHELCDLNAGAGELNAGYQQALKQFEASDFAAAARSLTELLVRFPKDGPTLVLLSRVVNALVDGRPEEHPVWNLTRK
ncbi:MAG: adenylate/guanylate cyclase domain-containing protein [Planctomycetota bacterium]